jgi:hypothetical protein
MIYNLDAFKVISEIHNRATHVVIHRADDGEIMIPVATKMIQTQIDGWEVHADVLIENDGTDPHLVGWGFRDEHGEPLNDRYEDWGRMAPGDIFTAHLSVRLNTEDVPPKITHELRSRR